MVFFLFRETMETDAMWQFIEKISRFNIVSILPLITHESSLLIIFRKEIKRLVKMRAFITKLKQAQNKMQCH